MPTFPKELREYFAKEGRRGGKATAKKLTQAQRKESAQKAAQARWKRIYHTDELLRKHRLVIDDNGETRRLVDWQTHRPASASRVKQYLEAKQKKESK